MICEKCKKTIKDGSKFCPYCGGPTNLNGKKTIRTEKDILGGEKYNTIKESYDNEAFMKQRKYCLLGLLIILLVLSGCVVNKDRNGEDATEECNSEITTDIEEMDEEALVAGRYYEYCKNGEMYQSELLSIETPLDLFQD